MCVCRSKSWTTLCITTKPLLWLATVCDQRGFTRFPELDPPISPSYADPYERPRSAWMSCPFWNLMASPPFYVHDQEPVHAEAHTPSWCGASSGT